MKNYYYVHTGHRVGLDRFRRACAIVSSLPELDITLLCSDFRIASEAKNYGVQKAVGIDDVRNIPKIAKRWDNLIYDSLEANPIMLEDMRSFFTNFIRLSDNLNDQKAHNEHIISPYLSGDGICNGIAVDPRYFGSFKKEIEVGFFFGDDDYEKDLEKNLGFLDGLDVTLGLGYYYFLDYEDMLKNHFKKHYEFDEYSDFITKTNILITASPQSVFESLASGGRPIYILREDYPQEFLPLFEKFGVSIVKNYDAMLLNDILSTINEKKLDQIEQNSNKIATFIKDILD